MKFELPAFSPASRCRIAITSLYLVLCSAGAGLAEGTAPPPGLAPGTEVAPSIPAPPEGPEIAIEKPKVVDLGEGRFRVGAILVDKTRKRFEVAATVLRDAPPLEFLIISKGGYKAYESVIEAEASAFEFNLACILIGLETAPTPERHFDPEPVDGDPVGVFVEWSDGGKPIRVDAADLLNPESGEVAPAEWVYTGSSFTPEGRYRAHEDGTLVGFVHDPSSIIEHRTGYIGGFDTLGTNRELLPALGSKVKVIVERGTSAAKQEKAQTPP